MYVKLVILAVGLFLFFRILTFLNKILPFSKEGKHMAGIVLPLTELVFWLGLVIWSTRVVYESGAYTTLIVFGVLVLVFIVPAWFLIRDFLFGMLLKIQRKIDLKTKIEVGNITGEVVKIGLFSFDIKSKSGNIDTIPYNKIRLRIISKSGDNIYLEKQLLQFNLPLTFNLSTTEEKLKTTLLNPPWVASSQQPIINNISVAGNQYNIDVFVYLLNKGNAEKIREYVIKNFGE